MTPQEEQRLRILLMKQAANYDPSAPKMSMESQVQKFANAPVTGGMMKPYIDKAEASAAADARATDLVGAENKLKSQRAYAESLRGREMPRGQSVGPLDVYVQPNWAESLQGALNPVIGGLVDRSANKKEDALSEKRTALNKALLAESDADKAREIAVQEREWERTLGRDEVDDEQVLKTFNADEAERSRSANLDAASREPIAFKDKDGERRYVMPSWDEKRGEVVYLDENRKPVDITGWEREYKTYGSGSYTSGTRKTPTTWVDDFGNVKFTYTKGDQEYDRDTDQPVEPGWIKEGGYRQTDLMNEGQIAKNLTTLRDKYAPVLTLMNKIEAADEAALFPDGIPEGETRFSWLTKQRNSLGQMARLAGDVFSEGAPMGDKFAAAQEVVNEVMRQRVGLSQTVTEQANVFLEAGQDMLSEPEVFEGWWKRMQDALSEDARLLEATTSPLILDIYQRQKAGIDENGSILDRTGPNRRGGGANANTPAESLEEERERLRRELEELY